MRNRVPPSSPALAGVDQSMLATAALAWHRRWLRPLAGAAR